MLNVVVCALASNESRDFFFFYYNIIIVSTSRRRRYTYYKNQLSGVRGPWSKSGPRRRKTGHPKWPRTKITRTRNTLIIIEIIMFVFNVYLRVTTKYNRYLPCLMNEMLFSVINVLIFAASRKRFFVSSAPPIETELPTPNRVRLYYILIRSTSIQNNVYEKILLYIL